MDELASGQGPAPAGSIYRLALAVADDARSRGWRLKRLARARSGSSPSCYLSMVDVAGREWLIRVSDHLRQSHSKWPRPHLSFVSRDGVSGRDLATGWMEAVENGLVRWTGGGDACRLARKGGPG